MAGLKEIAEATGYSISAVSRALNPKPDANARLSESARAAILEAAARLGYQPNRAAEFLKRGKAPAIGVFLPKSANRLVADCIFGIAEAAEKAGFPLSFRFGQTPQKYREFIESTSNRSQCGIITYPYFHLGQSTTAMIESFLKGGGRMVMMGTDTTVDGVPLVHMDEVEGGRLAARRFLARQCQSFAVIGAYPGRNEGYAEVLRQAGHEPANYGIDNTSLASLADQVATEKGKLWGLFAVTDRDAVHAMNILKRRGLEVGQDVLLIGYDDLDLVKDLDPSLTTIYQPFDEMGRIAAETLIEHIYGKVAENMLVTPSLAERDSG